MFSCKHIRVRLKHSFATFVVAAQRGWIWSRVVIEFDRATQLEVSLPVYLVCVDVDRENDGAAHEWRRDEEEADDCRTWRTRRSREPCDRTDESRSSQLTVDPCDLNLRSQEGRPDEPGKNRRVHRRAIEQRPASVCRSTGSRNLE